MKKLVALLLVVLALAAMTGSAAAKARGYGIVFGDKTIQLGNGKILEHPSSRAHK